MRDQSIVEIFGMCLITALAFGAIIFDGEIGEGLMVAISAALGAIVAHVYHTGVEVTDDEAEVPK